MVGGVSDELCATALQLCRDRASKAVILVSRVNLILGLNYHAVTTHFCSRTSPDRVDILIGCVDSRAAGNHR
jgi:hypothetical protein